MYAPNPRRLRFVSALLFLLFSPSLTSSGIPLDKSSGPASPVFHGPSPYLSFADSPFAGLPFDYFFLEDFEDGQLNTPGVSASTVTIGPSNVFVDSVDLDDGVIDGLGNQGRSLFAPTPDGFTFTFDAAALGQLPTHAGVVWTDAEGPRTTSVFLESFDANGTSSGVYGPFTVGDNTTSGTTQEDRFLGVVDPRGISAFRIYHQAVQIEVDHLQYGWMPCEGEPCIASLSPSSGGDTGSVTVRIAGQGFAPGAKVKLVHAGYPDISGSPVNVEDSHRISTRFDLIGQPLGPRTVVVTNSDGSSAVTPDGFLVKEGKAPNLHADFIGSEFIRAGQESRFWILVSNSGNTDAPVSNLILDLPEGTTHRLQAADGKNPVTSPDGYNVVNYDLAGGTSRLFQLFLNARSLGPIQIGAGISEHFFEVRRRLGPDREVFEPAGRMVAKVGRPADYEERYPAVITGKRNAPPGYIYTFKIGSVTQQAISMGNGEIRWAFNYGDGVDSTRTVLVKDLDSTIKLEQIQRPYDGWGLDGAGNYIDDLLLMRIAREATQSLVDADIPFATEGVIREYVDQYPNSASSLGLSKGMRYKSAYVTGCVGNVSPPPQSALCTNFISCADFVVLALNKIIRRLNYEMGTDYDEFCQHEEGCDNESISDEAAGRNNILHTIISATYDFVQSFLRSWPVSVVGSRDPNEKVGPNGALEERYRSTGYPFGYLMNFENLESATAPAQEVVVSDELSPDLDAETIFLGPISFGGRQIIPPPNSRFFLTTVDLRPERNLLVRIEATFDTETRRLTWRFMSLDPLTGLPPEDPLAGFLPPNIHPPEGEGSVLFTVSPKEDLPTGTVIRNRASIAFDTNAPIETQEWLNTLDSSNPSSQVLPLASSQAALDFVVQWSGTDVGSGIRSYDLWVSEDGGAFRPWRMETTDTSATFHAVSGRTYAFYSVARDWTGNIEEAPAAPDSTTQVAILSPIVRSISPNTGPTEGGTSVTITGSGFASGATLQIGGISAVNIDVVNATTMTARTAPHATGAVDVTATNQDGLSATLARSFFYAPLPIGSDFFTLTPCRIIDTRRAGGPLGGPALAPSQERFFTVTGTCGIPASAKALVANLTVVSPSGAGHLSVYPGNAFFLGTSMLNFSGGQTRATNGILLLSTNGAGSLGIVNSSGGSAHVVLDVSGFFE